MTESEAKEFGTSRVLMIVNAKSLAELARIEQDVAENHSGYASALGATKALHLEEAIAARRAELSGQKGLV